MKQKKNSGLAKKILSLVVVISISLVTGSSLGALSYTGEKWGTITVGKLSRTYLLYVPGSIKAQKQVPLVLVFHGAGGNAGIMQWIFPWNQLANKEGFLVVYPEAAFDRNWNDGRKTWLHQSHRVGVDDIAFIRQLITHLSSTLPIDQKRIFATGLSNGGMLCHKLGVEMSDKLAAIAPLVGSMPQGVDKLKAPAHPLSVLLVNGTDDPLVPWKGGSVGYKFLKFGKVLSVPETVKYWVNKNGCSAKPLIQNLPDLVKDDNTTIRVETYSSGKKGSEVVLYAVEGGGHTWPGGPQYFPESIIGKINRDLSDFQQVLWEFFKKHPKQ